MPFKLFSILSSTFRHLRFTHTFSANCLAIRDCRLVKYPVVSKRIVFLFKLFAKWCEIRTSSADANSSCGIWVTSINIPSYLNFPSLRAAGLPVTTIISTSEVSCSSSWSSISAAEPLIYAPRKPSPLLPISLTHFAAIFFAIPIFINIRLPYNNT